MSEGDQEVLGSTTSELTLNEGLVFCRPKADRSVVFCIVSENVEETTGCDGSDREIAGREA